MKFFLSVVLSTALVCRAFAQEYSYINFNDENGLPTSEVYQLYQDDAGFIWFATDNGVAKYDGRDFKLFNKSTGLSDQVIFGFYVDRKKNLWCRSFSGALSFIRNDSAFAYPYNETLKSIVRQSIVGDISVDETTTLHFTTYMGGVYATIDSVGKVVYHPQENNSLFLEKINKDALIGYKGLTSELISINIDGKTFPVKRDANFENSAVKTHILWNQKQYISLDRALFVYDGQRLTKVYEAKSPIINLSIDRQNNLWIGCFNGGALRFNNEAFKNPGTIPVLNERSVTTVLEDHEGGLWVSTLDDGVFYFPNLSIKNSLLAENHQAECIASNEQFLFTGNHKGVLSCMDIASKKIIWIKNLGTPILALSMRPENGLMLSTVKYTAGVDFNGNLSNVNNSISSVKKFYTFNDTIWGVNQNAVYRFAKTGEALSSNPIDFWGRNILVTKSSVLITGITGLVKFNRSFTKSVNISRAKDFKISTLIAMGEDAFFIGTQGSGVHCLRDTTLQSFSRESSIVGNSILSAIRVENSIWACGESGVVKIDIGSLLHGAYHYKKLDRFSGLIANKINLLISANDSIWSFSESGYSMFSKNILTFSNEVPKFYYKTRTINSDAIRTLGALSLPFDKNNIETDFGFISFNNQNVFVRYRIQAEDSEWKSTNERSIAFYSLAPGDYEFAIDYSVDKARWISIIPREKFTIEKRFTDSWPFKILIFILIVGIIYYILQARYERFKDIKNKELEIQAKLRDERDRIAQDLHDNIGTQLTLVALGLNRLSRNAADPAEVANLHEGVNVTMHELRDTIWALNRSSLWIHELKDKISNLIWQLRQNSSEINFSFKFNEPLPSLELKSVNAIHFFRIIQEALNNCIKHSKAKDVVVELHVRNDGTVLATVCDNGIGLVNVHTDGELHYGFANMKKRADEMNGVITFESKENAFTKISLMFKAKG